MKHLRLLIASTSTTHGSTYLEYLKDELVLHFIGVSKILFIPYAQPGGITYDVYTKMVEVFFNSIGKKVVGLHHFDDKAAAIKKAEGIFTGGGNSFVLLNALYKENLIDSLRESLQRGTPYLGTSAGANILGPTIKTSNDMPIVYPPGFEALGLVPFQINPHYVDADPSSLHMGETRETRINEYLAFNDTPVLGIREGTYLQLLDGVLLMKGKGGIRLFKVNEPPRELLETEDLDFLIV